MRMSIVQLHVPTLSDSCCHNTVLCSHSQSDHLNTDVTHCVELIFF